MTFLPGSAPITDSQCFINTWVSHFSGGVLWDAFPHNIVQEAIQNKLAFGILGPLLRMAGPSVHTESA